MGNRTGDNQQRRGVPTFVWAAGLLVVAVLLIPGFGLSLPNPFGTDQTEKPHPALLQSLQDLADFHAATGEFQVIIDLDDDARYLPDFLRGEETTLLAIGSVDGVVDLSRLGGDAIVVDGESVLIIVPPARLSDPHIDLDRTEVLSRERGVLDRIGGVFSDDPTSEREVLLLAEVKLAEAAAESELVDRAEENTRRTIEALVEQLGFTEVTVSFEQRSTANP